VGRGIGGECIYVGIGGADIQYRRVYGRQRCKGRDMGGGDEHTGRDMGGRGNAVYGIQMCSDLGRGIYRIYCTVGGRYTERSKGCNVVTGGIREANDTQRGIRDATL